MELDRQKVVKELEAFHNRILNSSLAKKTTERDIMAIINAAVLLIKDGKTIKKLSESLKNCVDCKHFVGCECFDGKICNEFERV